MSTRKFTDYNNVSGDIHNGILIMQQMLVDIDMILEDYTLSSDKIDYLNRCKKEVSDILDKYKNQQYAVGRKIRDELMSPEVVEYAMKSGRYPEEPSKTFISLSNDFERCFDIEQKIHDEIVVPIWEEFLTDGDKELELGEDFAYVVHSGMGFISLPNTPGYRDNVYNNTSYISSSLLTSKHLSMYNHSVGLILKVNKSNFLAASAIDCVARSERRQNVNNIKEHIGGEFIAAGYSYGIGGGDIVTKLLTPKEIERKSIERAKAQDGEILNYAGGKIINEIDIYKPDVEVDGIFLKSNGCDILLGEFYAAKQMEEVYGKKIRVINQSVYRKKEGLSPCTKEDIEDFKEQIKGYQDEKNYGFIRQNPELAMLIFDMYWNEVVEPNGYEPQIKEQIKSVFDKMRAYGKSFIDRRDGIDNSNVGQEPFDD